jgi:hypothetical protein
MISVTVVNASFISTIGGGVFTAPTEEPVPAPTPVPTPATTNPPIETPVPSTIPPQSSGHHGLSTSATIAVGVSVALVVVILIGALGWYVWGRRRPREKVTETDILPLRKYPATKDSKPPEQGSPDGPPVEVWG